MKATEIDEYTIAMANCDWAITQVQELEALLRYRDRSMLVNNIVRAKACVETAQSSLKELELMLKEV